MEVRYVLGLAALALALVGAAVNKQLYRPVSEAIEGGTPAMILPRHLKRRLNLSAQISIGVFALAAVGGWLIWPMK